MLFLLNDAVFKLDTEILGQAQSKFMDGSMNFDFITKMGRELFSEDPLVHRNRPERARRLAALIVNKAPTINAALFMAPAANCGVEQVSFRYVQVDFAVMCGLSSKQAQGALSTLDADRYVWRRLAA